MNLLVFGLGYSAEHFLQTRRARLDLVSATVRSRGKAEALAAAMPGLETFVFDGANGDDVIESRLADADALLVSIAPDGGDPVLARYRRQIEASKARTIVYLSTIGVYGGADGAWIDETTPCAPNTPRTQARVAVENEWLALGAATGKRVFILRLAGIYGPGRNAISNLRDGTARRIVRGGQVFNRIHVADIAQAVTACLDESRPDGVYNVCDDEPAPPQDVVTFAAQTIGVAPPPTIPFEQARLSPMALTFWANNRRVSNRRLRERLGVELLYPTYRKGIAALAAAGA